MLLDHFNSFADYQPVDMLLDFSVFNCASLLETPIDTTPLRPREGGFLPSTLVETDRGFIQARDVKPGDMIYTFDGGAQEVQAVRHAVPRLTTLMHVPAGALGNDTDLLLPADQTVALELDAAERLFGLPLVTAKLIHLAGHKGIKAAAPESIGRIHITCTEEELIWAESGMLVLAGEGGPDGAFCELSLTEVRQVLASDEGRALSQTGMGAEDARYPDPFDAVFMPALAA
ncbi:Hint domain-containing protein [Phaeobacter sp. QD34_3]|uniref:Hint domain-containing protein n=1 Tax=unclassified Phaeobacter TaxID=2621772 RepID=UPI00237F76D5|nr:MULTISPECIES: Hint domain-containing protein [unclassified Phaeobacter]MDE4133605.1 Hint domain-containing protein [Phaeobacter sp. QD34_3]MDE4137241.1 Hint domain-containing protein [Phaeobacter sp. QD34_24]MDE4174064.1 Hint domain-containing protein [Phaeobacter sp. PT47_59]